MTRLFFLILGIILTACAGHNVETETTNNSYSNGNTTDTETTSADMPRSNKGGWAGSQKMTQGDSTQQLQLQADFEYAGMHTIQFSVSQPSKRVQPKIQIQASIQWSVAGQTVNRVISVANGVSISGLAENVRVVVTDVSDASALVTTPATYLVTATIVPGSRPTTQLPPTLSGPEVQVPVFALPSDIIKVPIPQDCGIVSVAVLINPAVEPTVPIADQAVQVQQANRFDSGVGTTIDRQYDPRQTFWVPLYAGATEIWIINNSTTTIVAGIIWGIDG